MNPQIKKVEVDNEIIYLRNSKLPFIGGWGVVHPIKDENNKIIWINLLFGGRQNFFRLLLIFLIVAICIYGIYDYKQQVQFALNHPCDYCQDCGGTSTTLTNYTNININFTSGGETN